MGWIPWFYISCQICKFKIYASMRITKGRPRAIFVPGYLYHKYKNHVACYEPRPSTNLKRFERYID